MTINPRYPLAVIPVVDYEPPPRAIQRTWPPSARHHRARTPHRPPGPRPAAALSPVVSPLMREAVIFADAALQRVLEVVDLRRPAAHLYPLLAAGLVDSVLSVHPTAAERTGAATLRRVRLQVVGPDDPPTAAEVFGTYQRGRRIHALACRVERVRASAGLGWQVVALHIG